MLAKKSLFNALIVLLFFCTQPSYILGSSTEVQQQLQLQYEIAASTPSDIYEHLPLLRQLASECSSVIEIGMRSMVSTWGLLQGLAESPSESRSYLGIDISKPPSYTLKLAKLLSRVNGISFVFWNENDMTIDIPNADFLFIDSLHTYSHLTYELETFSPSINKYIAMHDTSAPWGDADDTEYNGDYSEYPVSIDRTKRGLWPAVEDFLNNHPEWSLAARHLNNHGFTILKRVSAD